MPGASNFLSVLGRLGKNPKQETVLNDVGVTRVRKPNGFACSVGFQIVMWSALGSAFPAIDGADGRRSWKKTSYSSVTHLICCCLS